MSQDTRTSLSFPNLPAAIYTSFPPCLHVTIHSYTSLALSNTTPPFLTCPSPFYFSPSFMYINTCTTINIAPPPKHECQPCQLAYDLTDFFIVSQGTDTVNFHPRGLIQTTTLSTRVDSFDTRSSCICTRSITKSRRYQDHWARPTTPTSHSQTMHFRL